MPCKRSKENCQYCFCMWCGIRKLNYYQHIAMEWNITGKRGNPMSKGTKESMFRISHRNSKLSSAYCLIRPTRFF